MADRRIITNTLTEAAIDYLTKLRYSTFREIGFVKWGRKRADVLALNLRGQLVACEIKSGWTDYRTDKKKWTYRPFINKMWLVFDQQTWIKHKETITREVAAHHVGVLILDEKSGYLRSVVKSKHTEVDAKVAHSLVLRCAWRQGESKRNRYRRTRRFIV